MEGEFQDQGQLVQDLEEWLSPKGSQSVHGFFSEEENQESIQIEDLSPEGGIISNQSPQGAISNMVVIKLLDAIKGPIVKVDGPLCGGLYQEDHGSIIPWSETDPYAKMNSFTWSTEENDWVILGYQYNEDFNKCKGPINNGQFRQQNIKEMRNTEETFSKYAGSVGFNGIPREGNPEILIKFYKDQCLQHMTRNGIWYVFSIKDPQNKENKCDLLLRQSFYLGTCETPCTESSERL